MNPKFLDDDPGGARRIDPMTVASAPTEDEADLIRVNYCIMERHRITLRI